MRDRTGASRRYKAILCNIYSEAVLYSLDIIALKKDLKSTALHQEDLHSWDGSRFPYKARWLWANRILKLSLATSWVGTNEQDRVSKNQVPHDLQIFEKGEHFLNHENSTLN